MRFANFFVLRSSLLPADDPRSLEDTLRDPFVMEALRRASPSLIAALEEQRGTRGNARAAAMRYVDRMRRRPTPFSLMSGYSVGPLRLQREGSCSVELVEQARYIRSVRLAYFAIDRVAAPQCERWQPRRNLVWLPGVIRTTQTDTTSYEEVVVDYHRTLVLELVLRAAQQGATKDMLAAVAADPDTPTEEHHAYVDALIKAGLLTPATGVSPLIVNEIEPLKERSPELASALSAVRSTRLGENVDERIQNITNVVGKVEDYGWIFDLHKPLQQAHLSTDLVSACKEIVDVLRRTQHSMVDGRLSAFRAQFVARYGRRQVPLVLALDPDRGLRFPVNGRFQVEGASDEIKRWLGDLLDRWLRTADDVALIDPVSLPSRRQWTPDAVGALSFFLASEPTALYAPMYHGCPGTQFFARTTSADAELYHYSRAFLNFSDDCDVAEVSVVAQGTTSDARITQHAPIAPWSIAVSPRSPYGERTLDINDLFLSVEDDAFVLRRANGRRVLVVQTNALATDNPQFGNLERFLLSWALPSQYSFSWGELEYMPRLPAVQLGAHVLRAAQWRLAPTDAVPLNGKSKAARWDAAQAMRARLGLPRRMIVAGDPNYHVDFDDPWSVEAWLERKLGENTVLREEFPIERSAVTGPEGRFAHEMVIPLTWTAESPLPSTSSVRSRALQCYPPISEVVRLSFGGDRGELLPIVSQLVELCAQYGSKWFFDLERGEYPKASLTMLGVSAEARSELLQQVHEVLRPNLEEDTLYELRYESYVRETFLFGDGEAMDRAEAWFMESSKIALAFQENERGLSLDELYIEVVRQLTLLVKTSRVETAKVERFVWEVAQRAVKETNQAAPNEPAVEWENLRRAAGKIFRACRSEFENIARGCASWAPVAVQEIEDGVVLTIHLARHLSRALPISAHRATHIIALILLHRVLESSRVLPPKTSEHSPDE